MDLAQRGQLGLFSIAQHSTVQQQARCLTCKFAVFSPPPLATFREYSESTDWAKRRNRAGPLLPVR